MKVMRAILFVPAGLLALLFGWGFSESILLHNTVYGGEAHPSEIGISSEFIGVSLPIVGSAIVGALIASFRGVVVSLVLGALPFLFLAGSIRDFCPGVLRGSPVAFGAMVVGVALGFAASYEIQRRKRKAAQPGATDNPDDAQRLREDH